MVNFKLKLVHVANYYADDNGDDDDNDYDAGIDDDDKDDDTGNGEEHGYDEWKLRGRS